ncbi:MAG: hypothetical protein J3K34DRAFT_420568 [Monoraphidium minutum]|nr:MAG: hypothetical protein J3K34DRAFT_420568 [Monoraphidium minutum]
MRRLPRDPHLSIECIQPPATQPRAPARARGPGALPRGTYFDIPQSWRTNHAPPSHLRRGAAPAPTGSHPLAAPRPPPASSRPLARPRPTRRAPPAPGRGKPPKSTPTPCSRGAPPPPRNARMPFRGPHGPRIPPASTALHCPPPPCRTDG